MAIVGSKNQWGTAPLVPGMYEIGFILQKFLKGFDMAVPDFIKKGFRVLHALKVRIMN